MLHRVAGQSRLTVHPHVCGEHDDEGDHLISTSGSSPRVWGTYILPFFITGSPAVHPHVCGEHELCPKATLVPSRFIPTCVGNMNAERRGQHNADGSSPRVWGTLDRQRAERLPPRFIPTCVGNIIVSGVKRTGIAVHPHVCGEHVSEAARSKTMIRFIPTCVGNIPTRGRHCHSANGSSPRVWGTCYYPSC